MRSTLREYIRAALTIRESSEILEQDKVELSTAVSSKLQADKESPETEIPSELADLVASADRILSNNLDTFVATAQEEIDKLDNVNFVDMGQEDILIFVEGIANLLAADAESIEKIRYPFQTALYLIALNQNMSSAADVVENLVDVTLEAIQNIGIPGAQSYDPSAIREHRSPTRNIVSESVWIDRILTGLKYLAAPVRVTAKGAKWLAEPGSDAAQKFAAQVAKTIESGAHKENIPAIPRDNAFDVLVGYSKTGDPGRIQSELWHQGEADRYLDGIASAVRRTAEDAAKPGSKIDIQNVTDDKLKAAVKSSLMITAEPDQALVDYARAVLDAAIASVPRVGRIAAGTTPGRITLFTLALGSLGMLGFGLAAALKRAAKAAPSAEISLEELASLVGVSKIAQQGEAAADGILRKLPSIDIYFSKLDMQKVGQCFSDLVKIMKLRSNLDLDDQELIELSNDMRGLVDSVRQSEKKVKNK